MKLIVENWDSDMDEVLQQLMLQLKQYCPGKKKNVSAAVLATEEILILYKSKIDDFKASVEVIRNTKKLNICIIIPGIRLPLDDAAMTDDSQINSSIISSIREHTDIEIEYKYIDDCNYITLTVEKYSPIKDNLSFVMQYTGEKKQVLVRAVVFNVISMFMNILLPVMTGKIIVHYTQNQFDQVIAIAVAILLQRIIYYVAFHIANIQYSSVFFEIRKNLETKLTRSILSVKEECFDQYGTGPFITRITDNVNSISQGLNSISDMSTQILYYVGVFIATLFIDPIIFLCEIFTFILLLGFESFRGKRLDLDNRTVVEADEHRASMLIDTINGENEIKLLKGKDYFCNKINILSGISQKYNEYRILRSRKTLIISSCCLALCYCGIMILLGFFLKNGRNSISDTLILFNYFTIIGFPIVGLLQSFEDFIKSFNLACERVRNLIEGSEFPKDNFGNTQLSDVRGEITLDHIVFAYNHNNILEEDINIINDISLKINPGEIVAFVGKSGCGKSTLFRLLSGQRSCYSGSIQLDGIDIGDLDEDSLRDNIMIISQSPYLFNASIKENLLLAKPDATMDELKQACELACIKEEIEQMKDGFDTVLGENGVRISGGQKQRLAIAKGLLRNAKIIMLDESTSAIDNITQSKIKDTINKLGTSHTVLMIAHRLSTIIDADKIVLIESGKILAQGTHRELMQNCEKYKELYSLEQKD